MKDLTSFWFSILPLLVIILLIGLSIIIRDYTKKENKLLKKIAAWSFNLTPKTYFIFVASCFVAWLIAYLILINR